MNCQEIQHKLFENLPLDRDEEAHLAQCRECRETAALLAPRPSFALDLRVRTACKAQLRRSHFLRRLLWPAAAAAAVVLLTATIWRASLFRADERTAPHVASSSAVHAPAPRPAAARETADAQIARSLDFDANVQIVNSECNKIQLELDVLACGM